MPFHSPQSTKNTEANNRQIFILLSLLGIAIAFFIWLLILLFNNVIYLIPPSVEKQLGRLIVPVFAKQTQPSITQTTLNQLLDRLEANLPEKKSVVRDYQVLYIPQDTINAIAIPGERIIIYQGLLKQVESENELMMIMGHELGHFAHRDHLRGLGNALVWQIVIGSIFGDLGRVQGILQSVVNAQYSQAQEIQADKFGLQLLYKTYNHVAGATDFFVKISKKNQQKIDFLSSHPAPQKRIQKLENLITQSNYPLGKKTPLPSSLINPN